MNCQDFNNIINELADYKPMSATLRDESVSHAALCSDCAANLAATRDAGSYLLQAARAESEEAPARVKTNLLAAFEQSALVQRPTSNVQSIFVQRPTSNVQRQEEFETLDSPYQSQDQRKQADVGRWTLDIGRWRWFAAAAAIAAVVLLVAIFPLVRKSVTPVSQPSSESTVASTNSPASSSSGSDSSEPHKSTVTGDRSKEQSTTLQPSTNKKRSRNRRDATRSNNSYETVARNNGEYLPLTYLAKGMAMESGTVVRVELSRTALASLGFNTSVDNSNESVKAEVILGDDGVARAIRLVE